MQSNENDLNGFHLLNRKDCNQEAQSVPSKFNSKIKTPELLTLMPNRVMFRCMLWVLTLWCTVSWAQAQSKDFSNFHEWPGHGNVEKMVEDQLHFGEVMQQVFAEQNFNLLETGSALTPDPASHAAGATIPNIPAYELQALRDLYDSAGGTQWHWYNTTIPGTILHTGVPWDFSSPAPNPCYPQLWQGIVCTPQAVNNTLHIVLLELFLHNLKGPIPLTMYNLTQLQGISLGANELTGTLPVEITRLKKLRAINYANNKFTGTLPWQLGNMSSLTIVYLYQNGFSSTLPSSLAGLYRIQNLYLHNNLFTGPIPEVLSSMHTLTSLDLSNNLFYGTLPLFLLSIPLNILLVSGNELTGTIPPEFGSLSTLTSLQLANNGLTGTIPASLGRLQNLSSLYVHHNDLHGSIPDDFGYMSSLTYLFAQDNHLSGSLPRTMSNLSQLSTLFLQDNEFTGTIDGVFNATTQLDLNLIQLSNNQLTGPIPDSLFHLPSLQVLVLVSNCFSGSVPTSICSSTSLSALSLDGLRSASSCQQVMLPGITTAYVLTAKFTDGVPPCLFSMPSLVTLHLSGNGLTGTLPNLVNVSDNLIDLALSHNKLTGTIPHAFQRRIWYNLDLSYNKFSGTLFDDIGTVAANYSYILGAARLPKINATRKFDVIATSLSLRNNRLSSFVPSTLQNMVNISLLSGNVFDCELDGNDLPENDSGRDTYQCGSASFNISYYLWLGCVLAVVLMVFVVYYWRQRLESVLGGVFIAITYIKRWLTIVRWYDQEHKGEVRRLQHYKYVIKVSDAVCKVSLWSTVFIVVLFMPVYAILSSIYGTHTYTYAYTVSAAFLSGGVATGLMLTFFLALLLMLLLLFRNDFTTLGRDLQQLPEERSIKEITTPAPTRQATWQGKTAIYIAFFLINFAVVLGANIAYLYVVLYENSDYNTAAQISLSVFKLMWNNLGALYLMRWTRHRVSSQTDDWKSKGGSFFAIQLFVALFNFIAIPCLVVAAVNPDCFNSILVDAPRVDSTFIYEACLSFSVRFGCLAFEPTVGTTSYSPPFTYSYECSSSLITYYAPSFIYMALIVTFVNPVLDVLMQQAHHHRTRGTWMAAQLDYWVPLIVQDVAAEEGAEKSAYGIFNPYFDANQLLTTIVAYLGVLLTFGLVFPPIAVAMLVSIYATVYTNKIEVGRFLTNAIDQNLHKYLDVVESECLGVGTVLKLRVSARILLTFTCFFYAPFLFDTLGDSVGVAGSAWLLVVVPLIPGACYVGYLAHGTYARGRQRVEKLGEVALELQETGLSTAKDLVSRVQAGISVGRTKGAAEGEVTVSMESRDASSDAYNDEEGGQDAYTLNALQYQARAP